MQKKSKIFGDFLALFEMLHLQVKAAVYTFWATLETLGQFLFQHLVTLLINYLH